MVSEHWSELDPLFLTIFFYLFLTLYCSVVWGNCSKTFSTKLQKLQNRAARIITYSSFDVNADLLIDRLAGWKKLDSQRQIHRATMVYKSLNGLAPHYLREKFVERNTITDYSLRDSDGKLAILLPHTNFMKNGSSTLEYLTCWTAAGQFP